MKLGHKLRSIEGGGVMFFCPGCKTHHSIWVTEPPDGKPRPIWGYNNNPDAPTFEPSVLVRSGHYAPSHKPHENCWCTFNEERVRKGEEPTKYKCGICHSFVRNGRIQFLNDSTHELAGQTVDLPDVD